MTYPKPINDSRLTPDLDRVRAGRTQAFFKPENRTRRVPEDAYVTLEPPEKHIYAELIDGVWMWVNGCAECRGEKPTWKNTYIKCEKHDVCLMCGTPRSQLKETPWGRDAGFVCKPCADKEHEIEKYEALAKMEGYEYDAWDYEELEYPTCPYCDSKMEEYHEYYGAENEVVKCYVCDNQYKLTALPRVAFTSERIER